MVREGRGAWKRGLESRLERVFQLEQAVRSRRRGAAATWSAGELRSREGQWCSHLVLRVARGGVASGPSTRVRLYYVRLLVALQSLEVIIDFDFKAVLQVACDRKTRPRTQSSSSK